MQELIDAIKKHSGLDDEHIIAASQHADTGWSGLTYRKDCCEFFDANSKAIWDMVVDMAERVGGKPLELVARFGRSDMADTWDGLRNLLAWFALEEAGRWLESQVEINETVEEGAGR